MDIRIDTTRKKLALMGPEITVAEIMECISRIDPGTPLSEYKIVPAEEMDKKEPGIKWDWTIPTYHTPSVWRGPDFPYITCNTVPATSGKADQVKETVRNHHVYAGPSGRTVIRNSDLDDTCQEETEADRLICCGENGCIKQK